MTDPEAVFEQLIEDDPQASDIELLRAFPKALVSQLITDNPEIGEEELIAASKDCLRAWDQRERQGATGSEEATPARTARWLIVPPDRK